jgi:hypothetical protein
MAFNLRNRSFLKEIDFTPRRADHHHRRPVQAVAGADFIHSDVWVSMRASGEPG